jgi:hypothetical protein
MSLKVWSGAPKLGRHSSEAKRSAPYLPFGLLGLRPGL